jgi:hypothetical protein
MAGKYSFAEKTRRTLSLLMGLQHPQVELLLRERGLTPSDVEEGQRLLLDAIKLHTSTVRVRPPDEFDPEAAPLAFRAQWFAVCKARLKRHYPQLAERMGELNKRQRGTRPYGQVHCFLQMLDAMQKAEGPFEAQGPAAREALRQLGLTDSIVEDLEANMSLIAQMDPSAPRPDRAARTRAEDAMWAWYIEWSTIARKLVTNLTLRRALGLGKARKPRSIAPQQGEQAAE